MKPMHYKKRLKYLNETAKYLISLGYHVETPSANHDLLDVWGTINGKRCFQEIYVCMYEWDEGINGIWHQGEHDGIEMFLSNNPIYGLDTRNSIESILDDLKPFKRGRMK